MTYENVISWAEKHLPLNDYEDFSDWYSAVKEKVNTPALFSSATFNRMMEDRWLGEFGNFDRAEPEAISSRQDIQARLPIPEERKPEDKAIVIMPKTGSAPVIPKPVLVFPQNIPEKEKQSLLSRFKNFVLRRKK